MLQPEIQKDIHDGSHWQIPVILAHFMQQNRESSKILTIKSRIQLPISVQIKLHQQKSSKPPDTITHGFLYNQAHPYTQRILVHT